MVPLSISRSFSTLHPARFCFRQKASGTALALLLAAVPVMAQVLTIDTSGKNPGVATNAPVDRQYQQIKPTQVDLPKTPLDEKTRLGLIRVLQSEQGFAMRPLPRGHKGLTLAANGELTPAGAPYLNDVVSNGVSVKPGDRVVISDLKIERDRITFELNGGPDLKHRFLRHVEVGGGMGGDVNPVVEDDGSQATGSRLTLVFDKRIPALTGSQVKALLSPLISFDVKSPIQAYTDTLPPQLKDAILNHQALVGMSTDMLLFAKGQPHNKTREMDGQMPFEEWIYGTPPEDVEFVRINGNRVIRVEIAKIGHQPVVYETDVVSAMMRTDGTPVITAQNNIHVVREGDAQPDLNREAAAAPPTLGNANDGEKPAPSGDAASRAQTMGPVQRPKPHADDASLGANPDDQQPAAQAQPSAGDESQPASPTAAPASQPANAGQPN